MADIDPKLFEDLGKLGKLIESANSAFNNFTKSATASSYIRKQKEIDELRRMDELVKSLQNLTGRADRLTASEKQSIEATAAKIVAEQNAADELQKTSSKFDKAGQKIAGLTGGIGQFAQGMVSTTNALYGSEKVFSGVTPVVDLMANGLKTITSALASLSDSIPILSGIAKGTAGLFGAFVDLSVAVTKFKLEGVQRLFDTFQSLQKSGVFLAGNFDYMRNLANETGLSFSQLNKFVTSNIEVLSKFGGGLTSAAAQAGRIAKNFANTDDQLLNMYGSLEDLTGATASYMSLMAQTGIDTTRMNSVLGATAKDYLINMRALSDLTGLNADSIRKEQEARLRHAAYQNRLAELGPEAAAEMQNRVSLITERYGKSAGDYIEELIATNGRPISEAALMFEAANTPLARVVRDLKAYPTGERDGFAGVAKIITENQPALEQFYRGQTDFSALQYGVQNDYIKTFQDASAAVTASSTKNRNAIEEEADIRRRLAKPISDDTKNVAKAIRDQNKFQQDMDDMMRSFIPQVAQLTSNLYSFSEKLLSTITQEMFDKAVDKFVEGVNNLIDRFGGGAASTGTPTTTTTGMDMGGAEIATAGVATEGVDRKALATKISAAIKTGKQSADLSLFASQVKAGALAKGSTYDPKLADLLRQYSVRGFDIAEITGLNDAYHKDRNSKHNLGMAVDFTLTKEPSRLKGEEIVQHLKKLGFTSARDEYNDRSPGATGPHIHAELQQGAVVAGGSGGIVAKVGEGTKDELVTPLINGMLPGMRELIDRMDKLVRLNSDQLDHLAETKNLLS